MIPWLFPYDNLVTSFTEDRGSNMKWSTATL